MDRLRATDLKFLKGIGPKRAELLHKQLGLQTISDLLYYFPTHYVDRSRFYRIRDFAGQMPVVQVKGRFVSFNVIGEGAKMRLVGLFTDGSAVMEVVWFRRIKQLRELYLTGPEYILFGKPSEFNGRWSMIHPEVDTPDSVRAAAPLIGVYPLTEQLRNRGISSRNFFDWQQTLLANFGSFIDEPLPPQMLTRLRLMPKRQALRVIHCPTSTEEIEQARRRMKFEELLYLQLNILSYMRRRQSATSGVIFPRVGKYFNEFYSEHLPFPLTNAQKRVIKEIRADMKTGRQMNRLLQGDVGSGKTLVAVMSMLIAVGNGYQSCLMAPTEILATQHFAGISEMLAPLGINVKLLTGSTRKRERDIIHRQLLDGSLHILIGTHAVIEDNVRFSNLGFVVIDEQHRFGVAQRGKMWQKSSIVPHILVMTATPIPRTLAMTVYGDLDVSVIDELPPGRKPVVTLLRYEENRLDVYSAVYRQLRLGRQVYIVYPLIKENEKVDLKSLEEGFERIREHFHKFRVAIVHGKMKPSEKDFQMNLFSTHQADILVATTVIEVGVNVPNATTMIIENAERFGLSQLHQLRGRVGRGADQSYCILMSRQTIARETRKRLELMTSTTDGFLVAEADLQMRGPGDLEGTLQSGMPIDLKIASLATDGRILQAARSEAEAILERDPGLTAPEHQNMLREMKATIRRTVDWSMIS